MNYNLKKRLSYLFTETSHVKRIIIHVSKVVLTVESVIKSYRNACIYTVKSKMHLNADT